MAASSSDSDGASEIFWPGYVDAVTNLAINLLFVIAVMSIVVIANVLQMSKLKPEDHVPKINESKVLVENQSQAQQEAAQKAQAMVEAAMQVQAASKALETAVNSAQSPQNQTSSQRGAADAKQDSASTQASQSGQAAAVQSAAKDLLAAIRQNNQELAPGKLEKMLADKAAAEKLASEQETALKKLQKELQALKTGQALQKAPFGEADDEGGTADIAGRADVVNAKQNKQAPRVGQSKLQQSSSGGIVVAFEKDVLDLSESEVTDLMQKLAQSGPIAQTKWLLQVVSPKGFSEATRIAYYRINSVRNALINNGVSPSQIETRVIESQNSGANNTRVLVRPASN